MTTWRWVSPEVIFAVHDRQLAEHGGGEGVRDLGLIDSALARPQHLAAYGEPDAADLASAYAFGLAKNHGFVDGNKRTAWIAARLFPADNGYRLTLDRMDAIRTVEALAAGNISEEDLAGWFRQRLSKA